LILSYYYYFYTEYHICLWCILYSR